MSNRQSKNKVTGEQKTAKKHSLGYYIGTMVLISLISLRRLLKHIGFLRQKKAYQLPFTIFFIISCHCIKGISVFTPLPMGEGLGEGLFFVIMSSASFYLSFRLLLCKLFLSSYHFVDNCLNQGGGISSLFVSHFQSIIYKYQGNNGL